MFNVLMPTKNNFYMFKNLSKYWYPIPPYGVKTGLIKKQINFFFLPYISAFTALEWIPHMESLYSQSGLDSDPTLMGQLRS